MTSYEEVMIFLSFSLAVCIPKFEGLVDSSPTVKRQTKTDVG